MDTMRRGNKEVQERILLLQKEKDQLTLEYKDKRKKVDDMKDDLQQKIAEYSKLAESGLYITSKEFLILNSHSVIILTSTKLVLLHNTSKKYCMFSITDIGLSFEIVGIRVKK